jgi:hypothetical protein
VAEGCYRDGHSLAVRRIDALAAGRAGDECACECAGVSASPICNWYRHELAIASARYTCLCPAWLHACKRPSVDAKPAANAAAAAPGAPANASTPDAWLWSSADRQWFQCRRTKKEEQLIQSQTRRSSISVERSPSARPTSSPDSTTVRRRLDQRSKDSTCARDAVDHQARDGGTQLHGGLPSEEKGRRGCSRPITIGTRGTEPGYEES